MLSRTADHLLWMARYIERAENTARMLDVNCQTGMLPISAAQAEQGRIISFVHHAAVDQIDILAVVKHRQAERRAVFHRRSGQ